MVRCEGDQSAAENKTAGVEEVSCTDRTTILRLQSVAENGNTLVTKSLKKLSKGSRIGRNSAKLTLAYKPYQRASKRYGARLQRSFRASKLALRQITRVQSTHTNSKWQSIIGHEMIADINSARAVLGLTQLVLVSGIVKYVKI